MNNRARATASNTAIAYVSKAGRVHLAVAHTQDGVRASDTICGLALDGTEPLTVVPPEDVHELHNALLCRTCSGFYLHGGYRDFALAYAARTSNTIPGEEANRQRTGGENQLALF